MRFLLLSTSIVAVCLGSAPRQSPAADRLILRNLDILTGRTVTAFDEDGLVLDGPRPGGGNVITWDEVERGRVELDQPRFDKLLEELGTPLYRLRQRLRIGDYAGLTQPAEQLYPRFAARRSQTAYLVCQATMWSRLARGEREWAVEPYLRCFELLRSGAAQADAMPGTRRLDYDDETGISSELVPVWFNAQQAGEALAPLQDGIRSMATPRPEGVYVYYASLALAANQPAEADRVMGLLRAESGKLATWREVVMAQQEVQTGKPDSAVAALRTKLPELRAAPRAAALYWVGRSDVLAADEATQRDGLLALLSLPAEYSAAQPELAAAGLYQAAAALAKLKDDAGAAAVRQELVTRYASTHHAALAAK